MTLFRTVLRGLRSRALLSAGSVLLTALAIGSAVLGPVFSVAATNSFLVSRLDSEPNQLTGLTWLFQPDETLHGNPTKAISEAAEQTTDAAGPFAPPQTLLETGYLKSLDTAQVRYLAKDGACAHLQFQGTCPTQPYQIMMLSEDARLTGYKVGTTFDIDGHDVTITGIYSAPDPKESDYWFDLSRFGTNPPHVTRRGVTPYQPAPFVTVPETIAQIDPSQWYVVVDRRLEVPPDLTPADLAVAVATTSAVNKDQRSLDDGTLKGHSINDLKNVVTEVRTQQTTARNSIAPAVLSLVLVALALLLRLLMAAADLRMPEISLASLRGLTRRQMWQLGLSEPLTLLAIATPIGLVLGVVGSLTLIKAWLVPGLPMPLPATALLTAALVLLGTLVVAVLAVGLVLRVSLSDQLTGVRRPRRTGRLGIVLQLVLVALAVAVLASKLTGGTPSAPDVTDLVLPVLLAVVAGLIATRLIAAVATWWTRARPRTRSLSGFVATRAISRRQEGTLVILPITAAIAVCVFGAGVYDSAAQWRASVASTIAPAPVLYQSPLTLSQTVAMTHEIDPKGQYLMAATTILTQGPSYTIADTTRLSRVAAWPDQWTPGISTDQIASALSLHGKVPTLTGSTLGLTVDNETDRDESPVTVEFRLGAPDGATREIYLGPYGPGSSTHTGSAPYCATGGCQLQAITIGGGASSPTPMAGTFTLSAITADGKPVAGGIDGAGWTAAPNASAGDAITGVTVSGDTIQVKVDSADDPIVAQLSAGNLPLALPVVKGPDAVVTQNTGAAIYTETDFPVNPVFQARSVPLLGPIGMLIDYTTLTTDRTIFDQNAPIYVFARSDTPASMQLALKDRGATLSTTLADQEHILGQSAYALALRLYGVVAALVLLMALAGLFVSTAVQLPARRRDAASLRVVGVPRRSVMAAVLRELAIVLGTTAVAGLAAGSLAQYVVLKTVSLGYVTGLTTPALVAAIDPTRLAVLAVLAALLFGGIALAASALTVRGARGSTLRENAR